MFGFGKKKSEPSKQALIAVQNGTLVPINTLPDPVFAEKMLGDGFAIDPIDGSVVSPVNGTILEVQDSYHAYGIKSNDGLEILVHIGVNTVSMNGNGFQPFVKKGDSIKIGQKLAQVDLEKVKAAGNPAFTIVLITNVDDVTDISVRSGAVSAGETIALTYVK